LVALQAAAKAARAEDVQENVVYEAQLQADNVIALTGPTLTGRSQKRRRGLHVSILDMANARRSIAVPCSGIKASSGLQIVLTRKLGSLQLANVCEVNNGSLA
jgi:hypothetical protein